MRPPTPHVYGGRRAPQAYRITREGWRTLAEAIRDGALRPVARAGGDADLAEYLAS